jgi:alpha-D-ribose 1-methylphosphonate 5-triphosphate diphosphatase PhnM
MEGVYSRSHAAMSLPDAVQAASRLCAENPAALLGLRDRGHLAVGSRSDALLVSIQGEAGRHAVELERVWLGSD